MIHNYHEGLPGFHPDQIWVDGCAECEDRGSRPQHGVEYLDVNNLNRAMHRAIEWNARAHGDMHISSAEADLLNSLYSMAVVMERLGVIELEDLR